MTPARIPSWVRGLVLLTPLILAGLLRIAMGDTADTVVGDARHLVVYILAVALILARSAIGARGAPGVAGVRTQRPVEPRRRGALGPRLSRRTR
jgi:hypothetical protein